MQPFSSLLHSLWLQCSTLMLLDSAKDPLLFSVIHFKRPKQPHTVQVREDGIISYMDVCIWLHLLCSYAKREVLVDPGQVCGREASLGPSHQEAHTRESQHHRSTEGKQHQPSHRIFFISFLMKKHLLMKHGLFFFLSLPGERSHPGQFEL